jgi:hypothetical protein
MGIDIYLLDAETNSIVAKTTTESCGDFWFANVPEGNYILKVAGTLTVMKKFDLTINGTTKQDIAGELLGAADSWTLDYTIQRDSISNLANADASAYRATIKRAKSNVSNNRSSSGDNDDDGIWSPRSNRVSLPMVVADLDGDGKAESLVGGMMPGGAVISAARIAGTPIGGIIVKGGKNPGGALRTTQTNSYGEFEFTDLEPDTYTFTTSSILI